MRILSQDGLYERIIDVPYEQVCIEQKENEIWCGYSSTMDRHCVGKCFAKYSTETKAKRAMEMLRNRYTGKDEPVFDFAHVKRSSTDNFYFQFPADDEVEA